MTGTDDPDRLAFVFIVIAERVGKLKISVAEQSRQCQLPLGRAGDEAP